MIDGARSNRTARARKRRRGVGFVAALAAWFVVAGAAALAAQEAKLVGNLTATWRGVEKALLVTVLPALRAPRLRQPASGVYWNPLLAGPNFSWSGASGATEFKWCLQRFDDAGPCRNQHPMALMIKPSGDGYRLRRFLPHHYGIKWKWYVVACAKGNCVNSETSRVLYVQLPPAKLVAPANHARSVGRRPVFSWYKVDGATGYVLHVQQGKQPEQTFTVHSNALRYQPSQAFAAAGRLRWWVAACGRAVGCTKQSSPDRLWDLQLR